MTNSDVDEHRRGEVDVGKSATSNRFGAYSQDDFEQKLDTRSKIRPNAQGAQPVNG